MQPSSIVTVQQHILEEQRRYHPQATGEFSWLLSGITLATKMIASEVRRVGLRDLIGAVGGTTNVHGESVQKLDALANKLMLHCLGTRGNVAVMASEEDDQPIVVERDREHGRYVVIFDPLDGSSNIDVNVTIGTIFSILRREPGRREPITDVLQPGYKQLAAGYVVYGSSTMLVYATATGDGVYAFTLDPDYGAYIISHERITIPPKGNLYSVNEANADSFPDAYQRFLAHLRSGKTGRTYSSRYIGSLVADFHRTLLKGGIFLYPPTQQYPKGKLRLLYEANPIAMLAEKAGGMATNGVQPILKIEPTDLHQRTPLVVGSKEEVELLQRMIRETM